MRDLKSKRRGSARLTSGVAECSPVIGLLPGVSMTCEASEPTRGASTSSAAASPARTCRTLGAELASRASAAVCGVSSRASFATLDLESSSWKTSQRSCLAGWETFSGTWPRAGMMRSGSVYAPRMLERPIDGTDSSSSRGAWPTATAGDANSSGSAGYSTASGRSAGTTLTDATVRFPWPTPGANDFKGSYRPGQRRGQLDEATENEPQAQALNPDWVEALMGFPAGWTRTSGPPDEASLSTRGSRRGRRKTSTSDGSD